MLRAAVGIVPLLTWCACSSPAEKPAVPERADPVVQAAAVGNGLAPFAQFLGDWEGTAQSLAGNFQVAKRFQWLVTDSWLLEQTVMVNSDDGQEVARTALLYTYDPQQEAVVTDLLFPAGQSRRVYLYSSDQGTTWEVRSNPQGAVESMFRTTLFTGDDWQADSFERDAKGQWQQVEHMALERKN